jgi:hypothetical protein
MHRLTKIVVGHDFLTGGETALQSAIELAKRCEAQRRAALAQRRGRPQLPLQTPPVTRADSLRSFIGSDQLTLGQNMTLHHIQEFLLREPGAG